MSELPNRCSECLQRTIIGCDGVYELYEASRKLIARAAEREIFYDDLGWCLDENAKKQIDLRQELVKTLGSYGCTLSLQQIRENLNDLQATS